MPGERTVARFASDVRMDAFAFNVVNVGVATLAGSVAGEHDGLVGDFLKGRGTIMPVLPESLGNENTSGNQKKCDSSRKHRRHAEEMPCVSEIRHKNKKMSARAERSFENPRQHC